MLDSENIKKNLDFICYNKYLHLAYEETNCGKSGCYDIRDIFDQQKDLFHLPINNMRSITNNLIILNNADAFANINIYNASYAKLICKQSQTGITEINLDKLNDNSFTFIDITINNPIYNPINNPINNPIYDSFITIETDGTKYTCDYLYFKTDIKKIIVSDIENNYAISWFYTKNIVLFAGNMLQQSFITHIYDVVIIPKPQKDKILFIEENKRKKRKI